MGGGGGWGVVCGGGCRGGGVVFTCKSKSVTNGAVNQETKSSLNTQNVTVTGRDGDLNRPVVALIGPTAIQIDKHCCS